MTAVNSGQELVDTYIDLEGSVTKFEEDMIQEFEMFAVDIVNSLQKELNSEKYEVYMSEIENETNNIIGVYDLENGDEYFLLIYPLGMNSALSDKLQLFEENVIDKFNLDITVFEDMIDFHETDYSNALNIFSDLYDLIYK